MAVEIGLPFLVVLSDGPAAAVVLCVPRTHVRAQPWPLRICGCTLGAPERDDDAAGEDEGSAGADGRSGRLPEAEPIEGLRGEEEEDYI